MASWREQLDDDEAPVYAIGVVAELLGVSVQVVRRYDNEELIQPERTDGGQRRYSRGDIDRLAHIVELAGEGISLNGIRRILDLERQLAEERGDDDGGG